MNGKPKAQVLVWWVLWAAFLFGAFVIYAVLRGPAVESVGNEPAPLAPYWPMGVVPTAISIVLRWFVLPRLHDFRKALVCFALGIAFAESPMYYGLYLFGVWQDQFFILSVAGIAQFVPTFAGRFVNRPGEGSH